jgi:chemotaxis protein CheZ
MPALPDGKTIEKRIKAIAGDRANVEPEQILEAVESVMTSIDGDLSTVNLRFYAELDSLSRFIGNVKLELASLRPDEINDEHLPAATDQLEAIVGATEQATITIFEAVEAIEELTAKMNKKVAPQVKDAVTRVYEACSFQDITGQRITKVVTALKHIERKVEALLETFGEEIRRMPKDQRSQQEPAGGKSAPAGDPLMHGPQRDNDATSQDDIDALLASLD